MVPRSVILVLWFIIFPVKIPTDRVGDAYGIL